MKVYPPFLGNKSSIDISYLGLGHKKWYALYISLYSYEVQQQTLMHIIRFNFIILQIVYFNVCNACD